MPTIMLRCVFSLINYCLVQWLLATLFFFSLGSPLLPSSDRCSGFNTSMCRLFSSFLTFLDDFRNKHLMMISSKNCNISEYSF